MEYKLTMIILLVLSVFEEVSYTSASGLLPTLGSTACNDDDTKNARFSLRSCVGQTNTLRSCHFQNLYFSLVEQQWVYFECNERPNNYNFAAYGLSFNTSIKDFPKQHSSFNFQKNFIEWGNCEARSNVNITPIIRMVSPPSLEFVLDVNGLSIFWDFTVHSKFSYGHCLLNDWFPLFLTIETHTQPVPLQFKIFSHMPVDITVTPLHTCVRYLSAWSKSSVSNLEFLVHDAYTSGKAWIRFSDLILGEAGHATAADELVFRSHLNPSGPSIFNTLNWRSFRKSVYSAFELSLPSIETEHGDLHQSIVIVSRPQGDNRKSNT